MKVIMENFLTHDQDLDPDFIPDALSTLAGLEADLNSCIYQRAIYILLTRTSKYQIHHSLNQSFQDFIWFYLKIVTFDRH